MNFIKSLYISFLLIFANAVFSQPADSSKIILEKKYYYNYKLVTLDIDTGLTGFQLYNPINNNLYKDISLGNIGLPILDLNKLQFYSTSEFVFSHYLNNYVFNNENITVYKTNRRFTNVTFFNNGSKSTSENVVKVFHTQNLSPYFNISFKYNLLNSVGNYKYQASKDNMLNLTTYYDKNRFTSIFIVNYNSLSFQNNGGIVNDTSVFDSDSYQSELVPVNLSSSISSFKNFNVNFVNRFNFGTGKDTVISDSSEVRTISRKGFVEYKFALDKNKYLYNDVYNDFYDNYFYSDSATFDSTISFNLKNSLSFSNVDNENSSLKFALGGNFYLYKFYYTNLGAVRSDLFVNSFVSYSLTNAELNLLSEYYIDGLKKGDYVFGAGFIYKKFKFKFGNDLVSPNYFLSNLFTNNFMWHNNFNKTNIINLSINYKYNKNLKLNVDLKSVNNFIYFDTLSCPKQYNNAFYYLDLEFLKRFNFYKFSFITKNSIKYLPDDLPFDLPVFNTYNSVFYHTFLVKGVLKMQIGLDFFYNTAFKGYGYMPSLSTYYASNDIIDGYPFFDAFVNLKLKRVRFMLKYIHANQGFFGGKYVSISNYPLMEHGIRFGISWNFYD